MQMIYDAVHPDVLERMKKIFREEKDDGSETRAKKLDTAIREKQDRLNELVDRTKYRKIGA